MKLSFSLIGVLAVVTSVIAQTTERHTMMCGNNPSAETVLRMEANFAANKVAVAPVRPVTINVFFNVIYKDRSAQGGFVTDTQIAKQINVLNTGFFNASITFKLASIRRIQSSLWFDIRGSRSAAQTNMKNALRNGGAGDLNIYTVGSILDNGDDLFGYATFPDQYYGNPKDDGVVIIFPTLPDGSLKGYNLGRIMTHEVGHWVGLFHTFQGLGCTPPGDFVDDTPAEETFARGCPKGRDTCPGGGPDPIHNFMDYTDNACMFEFTPGQVARLRAQISFFRRL